MAVSSNFSVRIDSDIKAQCEAIFNSLGLNLTTAINVFLRKSIQEGGLPFDVKLDTHSKETLLAMQEAEEISHDIKAGKRVPFDSWEAAKGALMK